VYGVSCHSQSDCSDASKIAASPQIRQTPGGPTAGPPPIGGPPPPIGEPPPLIGGPPPSIGGPPPSIGRQAGTADVGDPSCGALDNQYIKSGSLGGLSVANAFDADRGTQWRNNPATGWILGFDFLEV
jgi:hypothetical protein